MNAFKSAKITYVVFAFIIFSLVANIIYTGITGKHLISGNDIAAYAKNRSVKKDVVYATRGQIYSSDGELIASNVKKYRLVAYTSTTRMDGEDPAHIQDVTKTAEAIAPLIGMETAAMASKLQSAIDGKLYQIEFGSFGSNLSPTIKKQIETFELPGIEFVEQSSRNYPMGDFASYIIGYAQNVEENGVQHVVGKMGFELLYDEELSGTNGYKKYQADTKGYAIPNGILEQEATKDGSDINLTINSVLQRDLDIQLKETVEETGSQKAACAIMEAKTGKILAISNYPSFNPNEKKIEDYNDFFINTAYEPGSVFKPFIYANVIDDGKYDDNATFQSGTYTLNDRVMKDHNDGRGAGILTYKEGLAFSSNVAICNLIAKYVDRESLISDYDDLGFLKSLEIDGMSSAAGTAAFKNTDRLLEFMQSGFGQGITVTPMHLLRAYSAFANDGKMVTPHFIDSIVDSNTKEVTYKAKTEYSKQVYSSETVTKMNEFLLNNIYSGYSVATQYRTTDFQIMGKTGTGQIAKTGVEKGYRSDIVSKSFAGLAPYEDPQIIIFAVFQCKDAGTATPIGDFIQTMTSAALATKNSYTNATNQELIKSNYTMDSFTNQNVSFAKSKLEAKEIKVEVIGNGQVILDQFPASKAGVSKNDRVFLKTDSADIVLPNMQGWSRKDVLTYSSLSGITFEITGDSGQVDTQNVEAGTIVHAGDNIIITLK